MAETKTATLTHKVRNPQDLDTWLNIWEAKVSANYDENNNRSGEVITITPSTNWNISADNLGQIPANKLGQIPVDKISSVNFQDNVEGTEKNYTTTNVTITSEPTSDNLGLNGGVALTNKDGSITERPFDSNSDSYLSGEGKFVSLPSYSLTGATDTSNISNVKIILNKNNEAISNSNIIINGSGKITTTYNNNTITLNLAKDSVGTNELADKSVTVNKIDWDSNTAITSKIKQKIGINSSTNDGMVSATNGNNNKQKSWATDNNGNPTWRSGKVTVKEQNVTLVKDVTSFIKGFHSTTVSPSSLYRIYGSDDYLQGASFLLWLNEGNTTDPADYRIVFRDETALASNSDETNPRTRLEITENNVTKNVVYE